MAKKKGAEKVTESQVEDAGPEQAGDVDATLENDAESTADVAIVEAATPDFAAADALGLVAEVQSFLSKRGELAEKLAREIEATEKKLEELKRTAALLLPLPAVAAPAEPARADKKPKKLTLKKPEKKSEKPRGLLDHAEQSGEAGAAGEVGAAAELANPQAEQELVAQG